MKIAIHSSIHSFSQRWTDYCNQKGIEYKIVNCYDNDIIDQVSDCNALMWHHYHTDPRAILFAKQLLFSLEQSGKKVFPDFRTGWHFNDKVGQKYLLEAIGAPLVPVHLFFRKDEAMEWMKKTSLPTVFKLRGGAGSDNVRLIKSRLEGRNVIRKAFGKGFSSYPRLTAFREKVRKFSMNSIDLSALIKAFIHIFFIPEYAKINERERGYVYFQDFIPGNSFDIRIVIIDNKAFAIKRIVRKNDFRASGSGYIHYERELFDEDTVRLAFNLADKLKTQSIAFDIIYENSIPKVLEISYGFVPEGYDSCPGYWDRSMNWIEGSFNPYGWMIDALIRDIND